MPWCVAFGCSNNAFSSFYSFPKDENLKKRWLANIKRENINKDPKICHQHFENSCFKRDLEVSLWYFYVN